MAKTKVAELTAIFPVGNGAESDLDMLRPYTVAATIQGTNPLLCHAWDSDAVEMKTAAPRGSKIKKTDNVDTYVYRMDNGEIGILGIAICKAISTAAKSKQDPRSARKSAEDLYKSSIISLDDLASLGAQGWDYIDRRRAIVKFAAVTRERPCFRPGWKLTYHLQVLAPEYITPDRLLHTLVDAGRFVGIGDHRPTFGRFQVVNFEVLNEDWEEEKEDEQIGTA